MKREFIIKLLAVLGAALFFYLGAIFRVCIIRDICSFNPFLTMDGYGYIIIGVGAAVVLGLLLFLDDEADPD